jgi:hypothetical protein
MTTGDSEQPFRLHMTSLLLRLQRAGWIIRFEEPDPDQDQFEIEWNPEKKPMGGLTNLYALATMLHELCPERCLSEDEQGMIQILFQEYFVE